MKYIRIIFQLYLILLAYYDIFDLIKRTFILEFFCTTVQFPGENRFVSLSHVRFDNVDVS